MKGKKIILKISLLQQKLLKKKPKSTEQRIIKTRKKKLVKMLNTGMKMRSEALRVRMMKEKMRRARKKLAKTRVTTGEEINLWRPLTKTITKKKPKKPLKARMKLLMVKVREKRKKKVKTVKMSDRESLKWITIILNCLTAFYKFTKHLFLLFMFCNFEIALRFDSILFITNN